ncbi:MAG: hypothetical protein RML40_04855 [Bacteroidota bacterium]|nr:hypothetical protein [Candidatus Kapabacteria bacterium]MDW8219841.1 hypothetical protein [Bacteroidota bacterium]
MNIRHNTIHISDDQEPDFLPPAKRSNWLIVYAFMGLLGITGLILIILYRQVPKKSAPVAKRTIPAKRTVFTSVLSPVDTTTAQYIVEDMRRVIGADSAVTNMVISGTAIYKRCTSLHDFQTLLFQALVGAEPENLKRQMLLLSHVAGVIMSDMLPTQLFIIGRIAEENFASEEKRLLGFARALGARNESLGKVEITTYIPRSAQPNSTRDKVLETLKYGKYTVHEHPLQWQ